MAVRREVVEPDQGEDRDLRSVVDGNDDARLRAVETAIAVSVQDRATLTARIAILERTIERLQNRPPWWVATFIGVQSTVIGILATALIFTR
jgi:hypothetical protein